MHTILCLGYIAQPVLIRLISCRNILTSGGFYFRAVLIRGVSLFHVTSGGFYFRAVLIREVSLLQGFPISGVS